MWHDHPPPKQLIVSIIRHSPRLLLQHSEVQVGSRRRGQDMKQKWFIIEELSFQSFHAIVTERKRL